VVPAGPTAIQQVPARFPRTKIIPSFQLPVQKKLMNKLYAEKKIKNID